MQNRGAGWGHLTLSLESPPRTVVPSPQEGGSQGLGVRGGVAFSSQSSHGGRWVRRVLCWPGPAGGHPAGRSLLHVSRPASRRSRVALTLEGCRHRGQQLVTTSRRTCREPQRWGEGWAGGPFQRPGVGPLTKKGVYLTGTPPPGGCSELFWCLGECGKSHCPTPGSLETVRFLGGFYVWGIWRWVRLSA